MSAHLFVRDSHLEADAKPAWKPLPGGWFATPMLAVLVVIELSDIIFAVDSIPAIFGVTREPFIVFSATALALVGLKFILTDVVHIGVGISLLVIFAVMAIAIGASLRHDRTNA